MNKKIIILLTITVFLSGCIGQTDKSDGEKAIDACMKKCNELLNMGQDLSNGPCLLNPIEGTEWVCDVAHSPRQDVDNKPENQCSAYREGIAKHFVEVNPGCELIKSA